MVEGVYINKANDYYNNFPVYRRGNDRDLGLYYHNDKNGDKLLVFGNDFDDGSLVQFGVSARLSNNPLSWLSSGTLNQSDVFSGLVHQWQYYNKSDQTDYNVPVTAYSPMIKAVCVDEDFRECNSDRVYLNESIDEKYGNILNDPKTDYFHRVEGLFRNLRPVYKHSAVSWYLQYVDSYWVISESYRPSTSEENVIMRVNDLALRPEYITKTWTRWSFEWHNMPSLRVLCRGVTSMSNICSLNPCDSKATCFNSTSKETLCLCTSGFTGLTCSVNKQCPPSNEFEYLERRPGDLGISFCRDSAPFTRLYLCVDGNSSSYWRGQFVGAICKEENGNSNSTATEDSVPALRTQGLLKSESTNFGDDPLLVPLVIYIAIFMQILLPFFLWCCVSCKRKCKKAKVDHCRMDHGDVGEDLGSTRRLREVRRSTGAGQGEELEQGAEERQRKRERKSRNVRFMCRLISMHLYFSFYLWLIFLVGCEVSQCTTYGEVFFILRIFAIVMLCLSPAIVLLESFFCEELDYLRNIIKDETAWEYIQRIRGVPPTVDMVVECYHYEEMQVLPLNACGNKTSPFNRKRKVVTFVDRELFFFDSWVDVSKTEMLAENNKSLIRVQMDTSIQFGDQETVDAYDSQVAEMVRRNQHRDVFTEYESTKEVPGLRKRICAFTNLRVKPFWIRPLFFWIATLLQMTWPYRWLFLTKTDKSHLVLKSRVYKTNNTATTPRNVAPVVEFRGPDNNIGTDCLVPAIFTSETGSPPLSPNADDVFLFCLEEPDPNAPLPS